MILCIALLCTVMNPSAEMCREMFAEMSSLSREEKKGNSAKAHTAEAGRTGVIVLDLRKHR